MSTYSGEGARQACVGPNKVVPREPDLVLDEDEIFFVTVTLVAVDEASER